MAWEPDRDALRGRVAVVAGATRGAGKGIAAALGEAGATVICTGRTTREAGAKASDYDRPHETIEDTADLVTELGGTGIARAVDHLDPGQVADLASTIKRDHGRIDVLVNDIWGAENLKEWDTPIWEHDLQNGLRILHLAIDTHLITSHHLLPLLTGEPGGLLVEVTDGTNDYNATRYRLCVYYDLAKVAVNRLAFSQGKELAPHGATAVAVTPGWMRSELMLDNYQVTEESWRDAIERAGPSWGLSETTRYVGRAVAALAADPDRKRWNQGSVTVGELAQVYGFTDLDGRRPDVWRYMVEVDEGGRQADIEDYS